MGLDLYVLQIRGKEGFSIEVPHNPAVHHNPKRSLFTLQTLSLQEEHKDELLHILEALRIDFTLRKMEESSPEQDEEQQKLLGLLGQDERVWPSSKCPSCFWFDPLLEGMPCGETGWPLETAREAYQTMPLAKRDLDACPVRVPRHPE